MRHPYITDIRREAIEEGRKEGIEEGRIEGAEQKAIETAKKMLYDKLPLESISKYTGIPLLDVEKLATELSKTTNPVA